MKFSQLVLGSLLSAVIVVGYSAAASAESPSAGALSEAGITANAPYTEVVGHQDGLNIRAAKAPSRRKIKAFNWSGRWLLALRLKRNSCSSPATAAIDAAIEIGAKPTYKTTDLGDGSDLFSGTTARSKKTGVQSIAFARMRTAPGSRVVQHVTLQSKNNKTGKTTLLTLIDVGSMHCETYYTGRAKRGN